MSGRNGTAAVAGGAAGWLLGMLRRGRLGLAGRTAERRMQVVEALSMGPHRQVMLLRCGQQEFLVGAGKDGVATIVPLRDAAREEGLR